MKQCLMLSIAVLAVAAVWARWVYPRMNRLPRSVSRLNCFTIGVFLAGVLLFLPARILSGLPGEKEVLERIVHAVRGGLLAIGDSMRLFVMGLTWQDTEEIFNSHSPGTLFGMYCVFLYFLAPVLTFSNVLNHFGNFFGALVLRMSHARKIYIMSALNVQSVAMAEEILVQKGNKFIRPVIVFADAFIRNEEADYELRQKAKRINGICLKNDVSHLRFAPWGRAVEIFLIGDNEAENLAQAKALTQRHKEKPRDISIYVYASAPYSEYILDSLDKGEHLLHRRFLRWIKKHPTDVLFHSTWMDRSIPMGGNFSVQRLDPVDMLVKKVLTWNHYADYQAIFREVPEDQVITITILGMGSYGMHFFKTAVWFYQRYGYCVNFNVVDLGTGSSDPEKRLKQDCPELVRSVRAEAADDAQYEVRFFHGIDCLTADFAAKVREDEHLARTQLVFIALGDDDRNIQAAMNTRMIFEQLYMQKTHSAMSDCRPFIYATICDDQKRSNLSSGSMRDGLVDYKNKAYDIRFVGTLETQYSYRGVKDMEEREEMAFKFHLDWLRKESQLRKCYENGARKGDSPYLQACREFKEELDAEQKAKGKETVEWNDGDLFRDSHGNVDYDGPVNVKAVLEEAKKYMRYAYYRNSSMAKADHKEAIAHHILPPAESHFDICRCKHCQIMRITEHMRWNAYTRSLGYRYNSYAGGTHSRAKLHPDLLPWKDISCRERYKD